MKIIYCVPGMYKSGGIERVIANKVNYWVRNGNEAIIITTDQCSRPYFFSIDPSVKKYDLDLNYENLNGLSVWKRYCITYKMQKLHRSRLETILMQEKADIVVSVWKHEALFLSEINDGSRKVLELHTSKYSPILMYPQSNILKRMFGKIRVKFNERVASKFDRLIILSEKERYCWPKDVKVEVIPNACFFELSTRAKLNSKIAIAVGRFEYEKNFLELIDIWAEIVKLHGEWVLEIYGDGWMKPQMEKRIQSLGIQDSVLIFPSTMQIMDKYMKSSIYLMTSHYEGLPMVLLEAQAVGLPIVSYSCPSGPSDIITDLHDGFLIESGRKNEFIERVSTLMDDPILLREMGNNAINSAKRFSIDRIMTRWEKVFDILLNADM